MEKEKREIILQSAQKLFAKYGLKKATVNDIASEAKIGKSTIYYYFKSKWDIFMGVVDYEWSIFRNVMKEAVFQEGSPDKKLRAFALVRIIRIRELENLYRVTKNVVTELFPGLRKVKESFLREELEIVKEILDEGVKKGVFKIKKIELVAAAMISSLKGLECPWVAEGKTLGAEKRVEALLSILFDGIAA